VLKHHFYHSEPSLDWATAEALAFGTLMRGLFLFFFFSFVDSKLIQNTKK
jgi:hypothetical protein